MKIPKNNMEILQSPLGGEGARLSIYKHSNPHELGIIHFLHDKD